MRTPNRCFDCLLIKSIVAQSSAHDVFNAELLLVDRSTHRHRPPHACTQYGDPFNRSWAPRRELEIVSFGNANNNNDKRKKTTMAAMTTTHIYWTEHGERTNDAYQTSLFIQSHFMCTILYQRLRRHSKPVFHSIFAYISFSSDRLLSGRGRHRHRHRCVGRTFQLNLYQLD